ncbi:MAG: tRNA (adenosine(37)-N6)-threonylcarbamoyltransferase complex ATPase subunit type 1 TsaE [bacterium]
MKVINTNNSEETIDLGYKIGSLLTGGDVIFLSGDLGAGKTTFTKGIGKALNVKRVINSPTFTIVKEYNGDINLFHIDLYRLENLDDFELEEYFNERSICVCEWPKDNMDLLSNDHIFINVLRKDLDKREFHIQANCDRLNKVIEVL